MKVQIRSYKPCAYPYVTEVFALQHEQALKRFGVTSCSNNEAWKAASGFIVVATHNQVPVAGMRLDVQTTSYNMPVVEALKYDYSFNLYFKSIMQGRLVAEACGWWVNESFKGQGLPGLLLEEGKNLAVDLGISRLVAFAHQHTVGIMLKHDFTIVESVGNKGSFQYPDHRYISTVTELKVS